MPGRRSVGAVKEGMTEFMGQGRDTLCISTVRVNANIFAVQQNGVISQQIMAEPDVLELNGTPGDDFFWIPGFVPANYGIGNVNSAYVQSRPFPSE